MTARTCAERRGDDQSPGNDSEDAKEAIESFGELIAGETLADTLESDSIADVSPVETEYGQVFVTKVNS